MDEIDPDAPPVISQLAARQLRATVRTQPEAAVLGTGILAGAAIGVVFASEASPEGEADEAPPAPAPRAGRELPTLSEGADPILNDRVAALEPMPPPATPAASLPSSRAEAALHSQSMPAEAPAMPSPIPPQAVEAAPGGEPGAIFRPSAPAMSATPPEPEAARAASRGLPEADPRILARDVAGEEEDSIGLGVALEMAGQDARLVISGLPPGARLSAGRAQADGSWLVSQQELPGLALVPAADWSGEAVLALRLYSGERDEIADATASLRVTVAGLADAAAIFAAGTGAEDDWIAITGRLAVTDIDGSERLGETLTIRDVPAGAVLSHGSTTAPGVWVVPRDVFEAGALALLPPPHSDADITLRIGVTTLDGADSATTTVQVVVTVTPAADAPSVQVAAATGAEDSAIALTGLSAALADTDGSETLSYRISNMPTGATLSAGMNNNDGSWSLTAAEMTGLRITPPARFSGVINLTLTAIATEAAGGLPTAQANANFTVSVAPEVDMNNSWITAWSWGLEDQPATLNIGYVTPDQDGSETWAATSEISGLPAGASLSQGTEISPGVWQVSSAALSAGQVRYNPAPNSDADPVLTIRSALTDTGLGQTVTRTISSNLFITTAAVADAPLVQVAAATGAEDSAIALTGLSAALADTDGSETLTLSILGVPTGASLSAGQRQGDGSWSLTASDLAGLTLTPPPNFAGPINLTLRATATEAGGPSTTTNAAFTVTVTPAADAPSVQVAAATGAEDSAIALTGLSTTLADTDGSETLTVSILGVPGNATLSAGQRQGDGSWSLAASDLAGLTLTPAPNFAGPINLTLRATATEAGGPSATTDAPFTVTVTPAADAPLVQVAAAAGAEDGVIALTGLSAALADTDGSETLAVSILGVPGNATLSAGQRQGDGSWSLAASDLAGLTLTPAPNFAGPINLTLRATATEAGGPSATTDAPFTVTVTPVADTPSVGAGNASGLENRSFALNGLTGALADTDGSETLSYRISNMPTGATLSAGTNNNDGSWSLTAAEMTGLRITPPARFSGVINLTLTAIATEAAGGLPTAQANANFTVSVAPEIDMNNSWITAWSWGLEDQAATLNIGYVTPDQDGSETWAATSEISGLPAGASLSQGTQISPGVWQVSSAALVAGQVRYNPAPNSDADPVLTIRSVLTDTGLGQTVTRTISSNVFITTGAVADAPIVQVAAATGAEDNAIALTGLSAALADTDGSETLTVSILGVPTGASLSAGQRQGDGSWSLTPANLAGLTFTPPPNFSGPINLTLRATATEAAGPTTVTNAAFTVTVTPIADAPSVIVSNRTGLEDNSIALTGLGGALADTDGSETLSYRISNMPTGATLNAGTNNNDGSWSLTAAQMTGLRFTPPRQFSGVINLTLTAIATETAGGAAPAETSANFTVSVAPGVDVGWVTAWAWAWEDEPATLNVTFNTPDMDGSETWAAITEISGLPAGASLSQGTQISPGVWEVSSAALLAGQVRYNPVPNSDGDPVLTVRVVLSDTGLGQTVTRVISAGGLVSIESRADAPVVQVAAATGAEDSAIALTGLSAALTDTDGSETLTLSILGVPNNATLSAGQRQGDGSWSLAPANLAGLTLTPPPEFSGTINLTLQATATERSNRTAVTTRAFTVTVSAVNDAPVLSLVAGGNAIAGAAQTGVLADAQASDVDSTHMSRATITLSGASPGETMTFAGYALVQDGGRTMLGNTGVELLRPNAGTVSLQGTATTDTYASILEALTLETNDPAGLAAGSRNIGITLTDASGAASLTQSVTLQVQASVIQGNGADGTLSGTAGADRFIGGAGDELMQGGAGADIFVVGLNGGYDTVQGGDGAWTDVIEVTGAGAPDQGSWTLVINNGAAAVTNGNAVDFSQPASGNILFADGGQVEFSAIERITW